MKSTKQGKGMKYLNNRIKLIKKIKKINDEPTREQLKEAYGYLDYCLKCGRRIRFWESYIHSFCGNVHKFGCSYLQKRLGIIYKFIIVFCLLPLLILFILIHYIRQILIIVSNVKKELK